MTITLFKHFGEMMKLNIFAAIASITFGFTNIAQADEMIAIKAGYMLLSPSGQFASGPNNTGTRIDMETDLSYDNSGQATGEITINLGDVGYSFGFIPMSFSGTGTLARNITYNGQLYTAGSSVSSKFDADIFDFGYTQYLINMDDLPSRFQLGIEASVKTVSAKTSMTSAGVTNAKNVTIPIPTMGLRSRIALADFIGVTARVGYLGYSGNSLLDVDAQIEFSPLPTLGIYAGYRQFKLKIDTSGVYANTTFQGPYAGAFFRF